MCNFVKEILLQQREAERGKKGKDQDQLSVNLHAFKVVPNCGPRGICMNERVTNTIGFIKVRWRLASHDTQIFSSKKKKKSKQKQPIFQQILRRKCYYLL